LRTDMREWQEMTQSNQSAEYLGSLTTHLHVPASGWPRNAADPGSAAPMDIAAFMRRNWLMLGIACLLGAVCGYATSYYFPRIYTAETLLVPVSREAEESPLSSLVGRSPALAGLAGLDVGGDYSVSTVIALLKSRRFIEKFLEEKQLMPLLFANKWDSSKGQWRLGPKELPPALGDGYDTFMHDVMSVDEDRRTRLVTIHVNWRSGELASEWANELVARINAVCRQMAIEDANRSITFLNKELPSADTLELRQSVYSLLESQLDKRMMASTRPEFAFRVIDPAQPPNPHNPAKPRRKGFAVLGFMIGGTLGLIIAVILGQRRPRTTRGTGTG
jgi:uncharacterized protein involved in exopolysaccharide biosynthesis